MPCSRLTLGFSLSFTVFKQNNQHYKQSRVTELFQETGLSKDGRKVPRHREIPDMRQPRPEPVVSGP